MILFVLLNFCEGIPPNPPWMKKGGDGFDETHGVYTKLLTPFPYPRGSAYPPGGFFLLYTGCVPNFCEGGAGHPYAYPPSPRRRRALSCGGSILSVGTADEHPVQLQCRQPASLTAFLFSGGFILQKFLYRDLF